MWEWKAESGGAITGQFYGLGCSMDWANQQRALGDLTSQGSIFFGILKEVYNFHYFHFGFVQSGYICKRDVYFCPLVEQGCLRLTNIEDTACTTTARTCTTHLTHQQYPTMVEYNAKADLVEKAQMYKNCAISIGGEARPGSPGRHCAGRQRPVMVRRGRQLCGSAGGQWSERLCPQHGCRECAGESWSRWVAAVIRPWQQPS